MEFTPLEIVCLVFLGLIALCFLKCIISLFYVYILGPAINKVNFKSKGKWALVTGSTDGIGKQYARELAARGCDIILVSRTINKLNSVAAEIERDYKVATKIVQVDFTEGEKIYEKVAREIADLEIGTLVNNVGVFHTYPEYFLDIPNRFAEMINEHIDASELRSEPYLLTDKAVMDIVNTNMVSMTHMTGLVMPGMVKRGKGVVINIGSIASLVPGLLITVYAASKAFTDKFSEGINIEYRKKGIIVQSVLPGYVCTNMSGLRKPNLFAPSAKTFVRSAISLVGTVSKTTGYFPHAVLVQVVNSLHRICPPLAVWIIRSNVEKSRDRYLKKNKQQVGSVSIGPMQKQAFHK